MKNIAYQATSQNHLGILLDNRLSFKEHLKLVFSKIKKPIALLCKLQCLISRSALNTIYKIYARPRLDYGDVILEETYNSSSYQEIKSVQYNIYLAITGGIPGTSEEKLYGELELGLLFCHWYRKLCCFYKFYKNKSPQYLFKLVPLRHSSYTTRNIENIPFSK